MTSYYTIVEIDFQYNDEVYYPTEQNSGKPIELYTSLENAKSRLDELNKNKISSLMSDKYDGISGYGYGWDEVIDDNRVIEDLNLNNIDMYDFSLDQLKDDDERELFISSISLEFYKIVSVILKD